MKTIEEFKNMKIILDNLSKNIEEILQTYEDLEKSDDKEEIEKLNQKMKDLSEKFVLNMIKLSSL